jgi:hypothetical protein
MKKMLFSTILMVSASALFAQNHSDQNNNQRRYNESRPAPAPKQQTVWNRPEAACKSWESDQKAQSKTNKAFQDNPSEVRARNGALNVICNPPRKPNQ